MRVARLSIENYRGIKKSNLLLPKHGVLLGDNNTGKTTVLEALDLVWGPDRLNRQPPIDEHDFFQGVYWNDLDEGVEQAQPQIEIEATVTDLSEEQKAKFGDFIEFWDSLLDDFYEEPSPEGVDDEDIQEALRITFIGRYDPEEDDFQGASQRLTIPFFSPKNTNNFAVFST